jgi:hypothetical protein
MRDIGNRACQTRLATNPRVARGVMEPAPCGNSKSGCPSPNVRKNPNQVVKRTVVTDENCLLV